MPMNANDSCVSVAPPPAAFPLKRGFANIDSGIEIHVKVKNGNGQDLMDQVLRTSDNSTQVNSSKLCWS